MSSEPTATASTTRHIRGSSLLFAGRFIAIAIKFLLLVLIVRYLTKADYGAFAYAMSLVEMAAIVAALGLEKAASRYVSFYDEQKNYGSLWGFIICSLGAILAAGTAVTLVIVGFRGLISDAVAQDPVITALLMVMILLAPMRAIDSWCEAVCAAFSSVRAIFYRRYILLPTLQLGCAAYVVFAREDVLTLAWCYLLAGAIGTVSYLALLYRIFQRRGLLENFSFSSFKFELAEVFGFSWPTFLSGIAFILRAQIVVVFLEWFGTTEDVAEYRAVLPLAALNTMVYGTFVLLYTPMVARTLAQANRAALNDLYWRSTAWTSLAALPIFLVTFVLAQPLVLLLFGERYASSGAVLSVLALGYYFHAALGFNTSTLRAYGAVKYLLLVDLVAILIALTAFWLLIPQYGAMGGAIGFAVSVGIWNILNQVGLARFTDVVPFDKSYILATSSIVAATVLLAWVQVEWNPGLAISLPLAGLLSLGLLYANRKRLQIAEVFPELLRMPLVGRVLRS